MTTVGGFALIVCAFIIPPIVLLHRSSIPSKRVWIVAIPVVTVSTHLGLFLGPVIFCGMLGYVEWPSATAHCIMFVIGFAFSLLTGATLFVVKRQGEKEEAKRKQRIQQAIDKITADGKVEGPKGPYVPHRKWNAGLGAATPRETKPDVHGGPYGNPVP